MRDSIIAVTQDYLNEQLTDKLLPYWYDTKWEFYGQTRTPKSGFIACGYFVTTTLFDAGFNIPRVKWAQSASEYFIKHSLRI